MASPKGIAALLPETLPDDFAEWDDGGSLPAPFDRGSDEGEAASAHEESPVPLQPSAERETTLSVVQKPRDSWPAAAEPVLARPQRMRNETVVEFPHLAGQGWDARQPEMKVPAEPGPTDDAPANDERDLEELRAAQMRKGDEVILQLLSLNDMNAEAGKESPGRKRLILSAIGAASVLAVLGLAMLLSHHGVRNSANPYAAATPTAAPSMPMAGQPSTTNKPSAAVIPQTVGAQPPQQGSEVASTPTLTKTQVKAMSSQLSAQSIIQRGSAGQAPESAISSEQLGAAGTDGIAAQGAIPSVFSGGSQPVVAAAHAKPVISSGVAAGMLIQKIPPVYPPAAKLARISGTVVLQATISKDGKIRDLRVLSGSEVLRPAAVDAVKDWRYRPFLLNNEPVEVETSINVVFNLGS